MVNNIRDIDTDRRAGKRTLAVRLGRERARVLFAAIVYLAYLLAPVTWLFGPLTPWLLLPWLTLPLAGRVVRRGPQPHRRPVAQRRAGADRDAPARLLHAAGGRPAAQPVKRRRSDVDRGALARAVCFGVGLPAAIASSCWCACEDSSGWVGLGEAAPLPDYDGVNVEDVLEALEDVP